MIDQNSMKCATLFADILEQYLEMSRLLLIFLEPADIPSASFVPAGRLVRPTDDIG